MNIKKSENTWVFVLVLFFISLLSASLIALVYSITKPTIDKIKKEELIKSAKLVLPKIEDTDIHYDKERKLFIQTIDANPVGYAFLTVNSNAYGGDIKILIGINSNCTITGFKIMESAETPGLGSKASEPAFKEQFKGKNLDNFTFKVKQDGGDVDAITAATITSRAVTNALLDGLKYAKKSLCTVKTEEN